MKKVYCKNCKWLEETFYGEEYDNEVGRCCEKEIEKDYAYSRVKTKIYDFNKQNKDNNCKYFKLR